MTLQQMNQAPLNFQVNTPLIRFLCYFLRLPLIQRFCSGTTAHLQVYPLSLLRFLLATFPDCAFDRTQPSTPCISLQWSRVCVCLCVSAGWVHFAVFIHYSRGSHYRHKQFFPTWKRSCFPQISADQNKYRSFNIYELILKGKTFGIRCIYIFFCCFILLFF